MERFRLDRMKIRGAHNLENFMAAIAACKSCGCARDALQKTIDGFEGLEHRLEWVRDVDGVTVSIDVTNTGSVAGKEVVQVYVHDRQARLVRPPKELKGFAKVELQPGETKTIRIPLDFRAFAYYDPAYQRWITEDGEFDILIGASAADIRETLTVTLQSTLQLPCILKRESTVKEWLTYGRSRPALAAQIQQLLAPMAAAFGGGADGHDVIGMDTQGFMMDMPLVSILHFQENAFPKPVDELVDDLLKQAYS
jgi:beta-glucosidase